MNTRERFRAVMNFQPFDRLPLVEWAGWWNQTVERWHGESLPAEIQDRYAICEHFGLDVYKQDWFGVRGPECPRPESHGSGIIQTEGDYDRVLPHLYPPSPVNEEHWRALAREQTAGCFRGQHCRSGSWQGQQRGAARSRATERWSQPTRRSNPLLAGGWRALPLSTCCRFCAPERSG